jgi:hypothetical protein
MTLEVRQSPWHNIRANERVLYREVSRRACGIGSALDYRDYQHGPVQSGLVIEHARSGRYIRLDQKWFDVYDLELLEVL